MLLQCKTVAIGIKVSLSAQYDGWCKFSLYAFYAKVYDWHVAIVLLNGVRP